MKHLPWLNLLGVLALAALCVVQWQQDRRLNLEINELERTRQAQEQKIAEHEKTERGLNADLAHFKNQFQEKHAEAREVRAALGKLEQERSQLQQEGEQLKASVTNWSAAVTARDQQLREAGDQLRDLSTRLNDTVQKFNELATNHNASIRRFNELATNFNEVVQELNEWRAGKKK